MHALEKKLKQVLSGREVRRLKEDSRALSAVLLPVYQRDNIPHLVFTRRTNIVSTHKGQVSFPGGVYQPEDETLLETALRESAEEIGLMPEEVEVLGRLDDVFTLTSSFIISPFVAVIPYPYDFKTSPQEIEEIIEVPIPALLDEDNLRQETEIVGGKPVPAYFYNYRHHVIWGATARILKQFLDNYLLAVQ